MTIILGNRHFGFCDFEAEWPQLYASVVEVYSMAGIKRVFILCFNLFLIQSRNEIGC